MDADNKQFRSTEAPGAEPAKTGNALEEFGRSLVYSAVQAPVSAVAQLIDAGADGAVSAKNSVLGWFGAHADAKDDSTSLNLEQKVHFLDAPNKGAPMSSGTFWAQQAGSAIGMIVPFVVAGRAVRGFTRAGLGEMELSTQLASRGALGLTMKESLITGFVQSSLFQPTDANDHRPFLLGRALNGASGALTLGAATAGSIGLKSLGSAVAERAAVAGESGLTSSLVSDSFRQNILAPVLKSNITGGLLSGIPAGIVGAQSQSLLTNLRPASFQDTVQSAATMSLMGGAFGLYSDAVAPYESARGNFSWLHNAGETEAAANNGREFKVSAKDLNQALPAIEAGKGAALTAREHLGAKTGVLGMLGFQNYGGPVNIWVQHTSADTPLNLSGVREANLVAGCDLPDSVKSKAVVDGQKIDFTAGKNRIKFEQATPTADHTATPKDLHVVTLGETVEPNDGQPSLLTVAKAAGVNDIFPGQRVEVFVHGTSASRAAKLIDSQTLLADAGNFGGRFFGALETDVAEKFAQRTVLRNGHNEDTSLVGIAIPEDFFRRLQVNRSRHMPALVKEIDDMPGKLELVLQPSDIEALKQMGRQGTPWHIFDFGKAQNGARMHNAAEQETTGQPVEEPNQQASKPKEQVPMETDQAREQAQLGALLLKGWSPEEAIGLNSRLKELDLELAGSNSKLTLDQKLNILTIRDHQALQAIHIQQTFGAPLSPADVDRLTANALRVSPATAKLNLDQRIDVEMFKMAKRNMSLPAPTKVQALALQWGALPQNGRPSVIDFAKQPQHVH